MNLGVCNKLLKNNSNSKFVIYNLFALLCIFLINTVELIINFKKEYIISYIIMAIIFITFLIFKKKSFYFLYILGSLASIFINSYDNLTGFILLLIAIGINNNKKYFVLFLYVFFVFIAFSYKDYTIFKFITHIIGCIFLYFIHGAIFDKPKKLPLDITDKERKILDELNSGKKQKEIRIYSQAQISKLLKSARDRNSCVNTSELLFRFNNK